MCIVEEIKWDQKQFQKILAKFKYYNIIDLGGGPKNGMIRVDALCLEVTFKCGKSKKI